MYSPLNELFYGTVDQLLLIDYANVTIGKNLVFNVYASFEGLANPQRLTTTATAMIRANVRLKNVDVWVAGEANFASQTLPLEPPITAYSPSLVSLIELAESKPMELLNV